VQTHEECAARNLGLLSTYPVLMVLLHYLCILPIVALKLHQNTASLN
jgi:hypothetical protein